MGRAMTAAEWRASADAPRMLRVLVRRRKRLGCDPERFRRFAVACARRVEPHLNDILRGVLWHLDRHPSPDEPDALRLAWDIFESECGRHGNELNGAILEHMRGSTDYRTMGEVRGRWSATSAVGYAAMTHPHHAAEHAAERAARAAEMFERLATVPPGAPVPRALVEYEGPPESAAERAAQADLLRCVFGNPFRPVAFAAAWRTEAVVALARSTDETRDFAALPALADALDDAGCADADLLAHCRGPGPHARGCHAVDHALGRWSH